MTDTAIYTDNKANDNRMEQGVTAGQALKGAGDVATPQAAAASPAQFSDRVLLPILPLALPTDMVAKWQVDVYARFMRHLRIVRHARMEIKILHAIQYVADVLDASDQHVAKVLVDFGLRAPRTAFPAGFVEYADGAIRRGRMDVEGPGESLMALRAHWDIVGEDPMTSAFRAPNVLRTAPAYIRNVLAEQDS